MSCGFWPWLGYVPSARPRRTVYTISTNLPALRVAASQWALPVVRDNIVEPPEQFLPERRRNAGDSVRGGDRRNRTRVSVYPSSSSHLRCRGRTCRGRTSVAPAHAATNARSHYVANSRSSAAASSRPLFERRNFRLRAPFSPC